MVRDLAFPDDRNPVYIPYLKEASQDWVQAHGRRPKTADEQNEIRQQALMDMEVERPDWRQETSETRTTAITAPDAGERAKSGGTTRPKLPTAPRKAVHAPIDCPRLDWRKPQELHRAADLKAAGKSFDWVGGGDERPPFGAQRPVLVCDRTGEERWVHRGEWWELRRKGVLVRSRVSPETRARQRRKRQQRGAFYRVEGRLTPRDREVLEFIAAFKWCKLGTLTTAFGVGESAMYGRLRALKRYRYVTVDRVFPYPALWRATAKGLEEVAFTVGVPAPPGNMSTGTQQLVNYFAAHLRAGDLDLLGLGSAGPRRCVGEAQILSSYQRLIRGSGGRVDDGSAARKAELQRAGISSAPLGTPWDGSYRVNRRINWRGRPLDVSTTRPAALAKRERLAWLTLDPENAEQQAGDWVYLTFYDSTASAGDDGGSRFHAPDLVVVGPPSRDEQGHRLGGAIAVELEVTKNKTSRELRRIMEDYSANSEIFREVVWVANHRATRENLKIACGGRLQGQLGNIAFKVIEPLGPDLRPIRSDAILRQL